MLRFSCAFHNCLRKQKFSLLWLLQIEVQGCQLLHFRLILQQLLKTNNCITFSKQIKVEKKQYLIQHDLICYCHVLYSHGVWMTETCCTAETSCKLACYEEVGTERMIPVNMWVKINRVLHIYGTRANWTYNRRCWHFSWLCQYFLRWRLGMHRQ